MRKCKPVEGVPVPKLPNHVHAARTPICKASVLPVNLTALKAASSKHARLVTLHSEHGWDAPEAELPDRTQVAELAEAELGGVKQATVTITGADVYAALKFESGVHRVQRVPVTDTSGRIHTSAASVVVLPQADAVRPVLQRASSCTVPASELMHSTACC